MWFALTFLCVVGLIAFGIARALAVEEQKFAQAWAVEEQKFAQMSPEELAKYRKAQADKLAEQQKRVAEQQKRASYGTKNPQMICPHCQTKGSVRTKPVTKKTGISGGKATAALLTGGMSMLARSEERRVG